MVDKVKLIAGVSVIAVIIIVIIVVVLATSSNPMAGMPEIGTVVAARFEDVTGLITGGVGNKLTYVGKICAREADSVKRVMVKWEGFFNGHEISFKGAIGMRSMDYCGKGQADWAIAAYLGGCGSHPSHDNTRSVFENGDISKLIIIPNGVITDDCSLVMT